MKKYMVSMLLTVTVMALTACGQTTQGVVESEESQESEAEETTQVDQETQVRELLEGATAESLRAVAKTFDEVGVDDWNNEPQEFIVFDKQEEEEHDVDLYGLTGGNGLILRVGDELYRMEKAWLSPRTQEPQFYIEDMDGDGEDEYVIWTCTKTGTGVNIDDLWVVEYENGEFAFNAYESDLWYNEMNEALSWQYDDEFHNVNVWLYGENVTSIPYHIAMEEGLEYDSLSLGNIAYFYQYDGQWYLHIRCGTVFKEQVTPNHEYGFELYAKVYYKDGAFSLNDYEFDEVHPTIESEYDQLPETVVNVMMADVTHDGVDDYIVTSFTYSDESEKDLTAYEALTGPNGCHVRVYDGNSQFDAETYANKGGYNTEACLWECDYVQAHAGNGHLFLTERDGQMYLIEMTEWYGQGAGELFYTVESLDASGHVYIVEHNEYSAENRDGNDTFDSDAMTQYIANLENCISGATLIISADIDDGCQVATPDTPATPYTTTGMLDKAILYLSDEN